MIQVIDIVQGRDDDTGDASVHLDRVYDHMYPDISTFIKDWDEVLVDMENTSWGDKRSSPMMRMQRSGTT
jgi:hypothetical protein